MSGNPPVFSRNGSKFPIYVQTDAFPALYNSLKELIHGCEGVVLDAPDRALAICITNRDTPLGANLIAKYYQADTTQHRRGVVDYHWVNACVDAQALLGPPNWGGYYLSPLTLDHFFNPPTTSQPSPSPSLSQAPTLVSPLCTPQYLPASEGKPTPSPRKPSLPTIPPQILQKFQSSGPSGSPTGCYSPPNATSSFGDDQLSRQLSATAEDSNSTDYDPAPVPPPESQKKQMTGGRSNKYYYTDAENDFIAKYLAWADRHGISSPAASHQMCLLMPWHPASSLMSQMSRLSGAKGNKGWAYVSDGRTSSPYFSQSSFSSKYDRLKLARRQSSDQGTSTSIDRRRRTRNNSTGVGPALLPERLMMWPPAEAPPEAPSPGPPSDPESGHPFTPEDKVYVVEFTRWAGRRVPDIDLPLLSAALEQFAPHHSRAKWFGHMSKYSNQYAKRVPNELAHLFLDMSSDEDEYEVVNNKQSKRTDESDASGSGAFVEPPPKIAAPLSGQKAPARGRWGPVVGYTDEELDSMAKFLVQNPERGLNSLFTEFAASRVNEGLQPQRKGSSYAQYARTHGEWLKNRGRSLLGLPASGNLPKAVTTRGVFEEEPLLDGCWHSDSDVEESDYNIGSASLPNIEEEPRRKKRGALVPYTEEELDSIAKLVVENPDKPITALFNEFAASRVALGLRPQRKPHTYTEYYRRHSETLNERGYLLIGKQYQPPAKSPELSPTPSPVSPQKPLPPVIDTLNDLSANDTRLGQSYSEEDYNALTEFLARHPALFRNSEEGKSMIKNTLWQKFDQEYPGRSPKAWREFFRKRADRFEQDALALIEDRQDASKTASSQDAQQPNTVSATGDSTSGVLTIKLRVPRSSAPVDAKNQMPTELLSPLTPLQSPVGTKRALSADAVAESSAPAAKKLREQSAD